MEISRCAAQQICGPHGPVRVNSLHYRAAALLSASPQLAESIHAAKRFRVCTLADSCTAAKRTGPRCNREYVSAAANQLTLRPRVLLNCSMSLTSSATSL